MGNCTGLSAAILLGELVSVHYTERAGRQPGHRSLPRLVIVIDEFASLARDLPDFVAGLVGIAQRGRSLGIHLIRTQPGGSRTVKSTTSPP